MTFPMEPRHPTLSRRHDLRFERAVFWATLALGLLVALAA